MIRIVNDHTDPRINLAVEEYASTTWILGKNT